MKKRVSLYYAEINNYPSRFYRVTAPTMMSR